MSSCITLASDDDADSGDDRLGLTRALLRAGWPGTRVFKSALASGIAWAVASALGDPIPMFAVFGALNGVRPTVAGSVRFLIGALIGILLGSGLAILSESFTAAPRALVVACLVALGLLMTLRLRAYDLMGTEVVTTGLLVFALSQGSPAWALGRLGETALGGGIAIVINAVFLPPDYGGDARQAVLILVDALSTGFSRSVRDLKDAPARDALEEHQAAAIAASDLASELVGQTVRAREALRFSPVLRFRPLRKTTPADIERYLFGIETLTFGLAQARSAARSALDVDPLRAPPHAALDELAAASGRAVHNFGAYILDGSSESRDRAAASTQQACDLQQQLLGVVQGAEIVDVHRSAVLTAVGHILVDIMHAIYAAPASR